MNLRADTWCTAAGDKRSYLPWLLHIPIHVREAACVDESYSGACLLLRSLSRLRS
jgi:hypothetical protein